MLDLLLELLEILWPVIAVVLGVLVLIAIGPYLIGGILGIIFAPLTFLIKRVLSIPAFKRVTRTFDAGFEQKLANIIPGDAMIVEFHKDQLKIKANDGRWYCIPYKNLGYDDLPNVRYTYAMAKLVNKRILNGKKFSLYEMRSEEKGGYVSDGYVTTSELDGLHTREKFDYVKTERSKVYGYKLVNYSAISKSKYLDNNKPSLKRW